MSKGLAICVSVCVSVTKYLLLIEPLLALLDEQVELDGAGGAVVAQHQQLGAAELEGLHLGQELRHGFLSLASRATPMI